MLSLFTVAATALGTLFFVDASHVGNIHGLDAVGVLILVWNAGFVALMAALILITAKDDIKKFAQWAVAKCKSMLPSGTGNPKVRRWLSKKKVDESLDRTASPSQQLAFITMPNSSASVA